MGGAEVEATLAVVSDDPASVAARVGALRAVGNHPLEWRGSEELRDVYLDTGDGRLRERGVAMRLRHGDAGWVVTLKGPARPASGGGVERSELELPWNGGEGLERVAGELRDRGVELGVELAGGRPPEGADDGGGTEDPVGAARALGLRVVQDRVTLRRRALVRPAGDGGDPVAELVVDDVRFRTASGRPVRHREVEVEATDAAPEGSAGRIAALLRGRFGDELRPWEHGKLATGAALEELDERELAVGPEGDLLPPAYGRLAEELGGESGETGGEAGSRRRRRDGGGEGRGGEAGEVGSDGSDGKDGKEPER